MPVLSQMLLLALVGNMPSSIRLAPWAEGTIVPLPQNYVVKKSRPLAVDCTMLEVVLEQEEAVLRKAVYRFHNNACKDRSISPDPSLAQLTRIYVNVSDLHTELNVGVDESYQIDVADNIARMFSNTVWGALRGLETLSQMIFQSGHYKGYILKPAIINDYPRLAYRGLEVDGASCLITQDTLLRLIDSASYSKFNVLILSVSDDNNFFFPSSTFPNLFHTNDSSGFATAYSAESITFLKEYSRDRGIIFGLKFLMPEKTSVWSRQDGATVGCNLGISDKKKQFLINPISEEALGIVNTVLEEARSLTGGTYLHLGGDVYDGYNCWRKYPTISDFMRRHGIYNDYQALASLFLNNVTSSNAHKWKGIILSQDVTAEHLSNSGAIIQIIGENFLETAKRFIKEGFRIILSSCLNLSVRRTFSEYKPVFKCLHDFESFSPQSVHNILGGLATLEHVPEPVILSQAWSMGFAVADVLWNFQRPISISEAEVRYYEHSCRLQSRHIPVRDLIRSRYCSPEYSD